MVKYGCLTIQLTNPNNMNYQKLFNYMSNEHHVTLIESDMREIERLIMESKTVIKAKAYKLESAGVTFFYFVDSHGYIREIDLGADIEHIATDPDPRAELIDIEIIVK
jgi:hypothetical protein